MVQKHPVMRHALGSVEDVSAAIIDAIHNRKAERVVPRWYHLLQLPRVVLPPLYRWAASKLNEGRARRDGGRDESTGEDSDLRIFVTGATGFIGAHVARILRARADEVVALVRSPAKAEALKELGCELVQGSLTDEPAVRAGIEGCERGHSCRRRLQGGR